MSPFPWFSWWMKAQRLAAWVLLLVIILFGVSGYGMTKGLIPGELARSLHFRWLGGIGLVALIIHVSWGVQCALARHRLWNPVSRILLIGACVFLALFFAYAHFIL